MRAAVVDRYGPPEVVRVDHLPQPVPLAGEVLVRVNAVAVTSGDARIRGARFPRGFGLPARLIFGLRGPRRPVLGSAFSGTIERLGENVTGFRVGDAVCGMSGMRMGAHAEFHVVQAARLVSVPTTVSDDDAAGVLFGGTTALHYLRRLAPVRPGMSVLVVGASGAVGTNAVQLARLFGADVTAVTSTANIALAESLGAGRVIDYTRHDPGLHEARFDIVLDTVGSVSIRTGRGLLAEGGRLALVAADLVDTLRAHGSVVAGPAPEHTDDAAELVAMVADGKLRVIHERVFPLEEIVEAYRCVDSGRKVGNVIVHP